MSTNLDTLKIRDARDEDWDWILEGMVESFKLTEHPMRRASLTRESAVQRVRDDIRKYRDESGLPQHVYIAEVHGERAGLVWVMVSPWGDQRVKSTWLLDIFVKREHRGKGIAKALMGKVEEWSRQQGAKELWLNVGGSNENALGLYRSLGFEIETVHMSKQL